MTEIAEPDLVAVESEVPLRGRLSVAPLQCYLRKVFEASRTRTATIDALARIGEYIEASYVVIHARVGVQMISEEWVPEATRVPDGLRYTVSTIMWDAISAETARCVRVRQEGDTTDAVVTAILHDHNLDGAGAAAIVIKNCDSERAAETLSWFEGLAGYLALLISEKGRSHTSDPDGTAEAKAASIVISANDNPTSLSFRLAAEVKNRFLFDLAAVGLVQRGGVTISAVSGMDELRASNPGTVLITAAMEECLDAGDIVSYGLDVDENARLHAQWSEAIGGASVASFPMYSDGEIVAVVAVARDARGILRRAQVVELAEKMAEYGPLVPLAREASRSVASHIGNAIGARARTAVGNGRRRTVVGFLLAALVVTWFIFGQLPYSFTVPCVVRATSHRTVSCPRDGTLKELYVRPGDVVSKGQLLASLDALVDIMERNRLRAEIAALQAQADQALAERDAGQERVLRAHTDSMKAQLVAVEHSIAQAEIRAPEAGIILNGDLREQLGSRITRGAELFELTRMERTIVVLKIPENLMIDAREQLHVVFSPSARPEDEFEVIDLNIHPTSTVIDGKNVFLAEARTVTALHHLAVGMEGVAHVDAGYRGAWWVLTHRITDWLKLEFWL